jgi:hypothetical protein
LAQKHRLTVADVSLLGVGAIIAIFIARPTEAFVLRFSTTETLVLSGLVVGMLLFVLRKYRKDLYGAVEVMVAFFTLAMASEAVEDHTIPTAVIGFLGAVYVLVRGMTNFIEGRNERAGS